MCYVVAIAIGITNNELASRLESQGIVTAVRHVGTACINKNSVTGDGTSAIPASYSHSPSFLAHIYVAVDTRPCLLGLSHWCTRNPSYHTTRKHPNRKRNLKPRTEYEEYASRAYKKQVPTKSKKQDPTKRKPIEKQDPTHRKKYDLTNRGRKSDDS